MEKLHASKDERIYRFYDSIHFSQEILKHQKSELDKILIKISPDDYDYIFKALIISWAIVDSINRIREIAQNIPGLSRRNRILINFLNQSAIVEDFRHYIQHLRKELAKKELDDFPVWGNFSWIDESTPKRYGLRR